MLDEMFLQEKLFPTARRASAFGGNIFLNIPTRYLFAQGTEKPANDNGCLFVDSVKAMEFPIGKNRASCAEAAAEAFRWKLLAVRHFRPFDFCEH